MRKIKALQETSSYKDVHNPRRYLIISQWDDKAAFDAFIASDTLKNIANRGKEKVLAARPHHEVYGG
jgi:heme-degrading monooxygenase HmoA